MTDLSNDELRALVEASTPGPWEIIYAPMYPGDVLVSAGPEATPPIIARVLGGHRMFPENAALIAAAPSLAAEVLALREERERAEAIAGSIAQAMWNLGVSANGDRCAWPMLDGKIVGPEEWGRTKWRRLQAQDAALSGEQP